jgi:hypothetical protein
MDEGRKFLHRDRSTAPYGVLLGLLVVTIVATPIFNEFVVFRATFRILVTLLYVGTMYAVSDRRGVRIVVGLLAVVSLAMGWWAYVVPVTDAFHALKYLVQAVLLAVTAAVILSRVLGGTRVTTNTLSGAVNVYLLTAFFWASLFSALEVLHPGSFTPGLASIAEIGDGLQQHFLYFSLVTMSTLGYGDVAPVSTAARSLATLEAVFGQLYLAILLGRLVGLQISQRD